MKYLIVGGAGFIGFHLAKLLLQNKKNIVVIIDNFQRSSKDKSFSDLIKEKKLFFIKKNFENINLSKIDKDFDYIFTLLQLLGLKT